MRTNWIIGALVAVMLLAGAAIFVAVNFDAIFPPPIEEPDYSTIASHEALIAAEFELYQRLHAAGQTEGLHPRAAAIVADMTRYSNAQQFEARVTTELQQILATNAEGFRARNPELWEQGTRARTSDNQEFDTQDVAALPYALGSQFDLDTVLRSSGAQQLNDDHVLTSAFRMVTRRDLQGGTYGYRSYEDFLAKSDTLAAKLKAALAKKRIYYHPNICAVDDAKVVFPFLQKWHSVMMLRAQLLSVSGKHAEARELAFQMLELNERAGLARDLVGSVTQIVVLTYHYISSVVVPLAYHGSLSVEDLEEIARRGAAIPFDVGSTGLCELVYEVCQYLDPKWGPQSGMGRVGLPWYMFSKYGAVPISRWFTLAETTLAEDLRKAEQIIPDVRSEKYRLVGVDNYQELIQVFRNHFGPIVVEKEQDMDENISDALLALELWKVVKVHAEELRRGKWLGEWEDPLEFLRDIPVYEARVGTYGGSSPRMLELWVNENWFSARGVTVNRDKPEFVIQMFDRGPKDK